MDSNDVVMNQVPIDLFEIFLNNGGDVELEDENENYIIHITLENARDYYEEYFTSLVQNQQMNSDSINHIPIYVDSISKELITIKEIKKLVDDNILGKLMSYIILFDFGNGMKDYLVLEIPRTMFNEMVNIDQNLKTNVPAGALSFSVDLMYILLQKEDFKDNKFFNFVTDIENGDVKGIIQEPDYKESDNVKILQIY